MALITPASSLTDYELCRTLADVITNGNSGWVTLEDLVEELVDRFENATISIAVSEAEASDAREQQEIMSVEIDGLMTKVAELNAEIEDLNRTIDELNTEDVAELKAEIAALKAKVGAKDETIAKLREVPKWIGGF